MYIADGEGRIRFHHFGEGEYAMTEMVIQQLLLDAGADGIDQDLVEVEPRGLEVAADWRTLQIARDIHRRTARAPASRRTTSLRSTSPMPTPRPRGSPLNYWALSGTWTVTRHAAAPNEPGGRIAFQFQARDVNLVMGPASKGSSVPFRVFLDGQAADRRPSGPMSTPTAAGSSTTSARTS